ncbi:MAG TPA: hypothetical protein VFE46_04060 [Pirellulales bacterium]|jgi:hypothetical protein|nr:hypothetical protein [Pirellulales bacterium]
MNASHSPNSLTLPTLSTLRDLLEALSKLGALSDPFSSTSQLQSAVQILLDLAGTMGLSSKWVTWLQAIQANPQLLNLVLAVGQYLETLLQTPPPVPASIRGQSSVAASAQLTIDWSHWLSLLGEILQLLEQLLPAA